MIVDLTEFYISLLLFLYSPLFEPPIVNFKQIQFFLLFLVEVNYVFLLLPRFVAEEVNASWSNAVLF